MSNVLLKHWCPDTADVVMLRFNAEASGVGSSSEETSMSGADFTRRRQTGDESISSEENSRKVFLMDMKAGRSNDNVLKTSRSTASSQSLPTELPDALVLRENGVSECIDRV